jgi:hypothetical protein
MAKSLDYFRRIAATPEIQTGEKEIVTPAQRTSALSWKQMMKENGGIYRKV